MKKFMALVCVMLLVSVLPVMADDPVTATNISGTAQGIVDRDHGDAITGGFATGSNVGNYNGEGPCDIFGQVDISDVASGASTPGTNAAESWSSVLTNVRALTNKTSASDGNIQAGFRQGNWTDIGPDDENFAYAGDNTGGSFNVTQDNPSGDIDLCGVGGAGGASEVSLAENTNSKEGHALTFGGSFVGTSPDTGTRQIDGTGAIGVVRTLGQSGDPVFAYGGASGVANYNATTAGPNIAGTINVSGDVMVTNQGTAITSTVNQKSGAAIIPCEGSSCGVPAP